MNRTFRVCLVLFGLGVCNLPLPASEGLSWESANLQPGKLDFHLRRTAEDPAAELYNVIWWSPVFKGGVGLIDRDGRRVEYGGGFVRWPSSPGNPGELIVGAEVVESEDLTDYEVQSEYRLRSGFGFGAGIVRCESADPEASFVKTAYRGHRDTWSFIVEAQLQELGDASSMGGYGALYNPRSMFVLGADGEQVRATAAYLAPEAGPRYRPAVEVLYSDQSVGELAGPEILFVNGTLKFKGGFLSHPARLGRAMGPTGLEFGNPIGFLWGDGPWNRQLDVWELGGLADLRVFRVRRPDGATTTTSEALAFPFQFDASEGAEDGLFLGWVHKDLPDVRDDRALLAGWMGKLSFLRVAIDVEYFFESDDARINLGVIDPF